MIERTNPPGAAPEASAEGERPLLTGDGEALERQRVLGTRLKAMFDHVLQEPIPDEFQSLLDKLDVADAKDPKGGPAR